MRKPLTLKSTRKRIKEKNNGRDGGRKPFLVEETSVPKENQVHPYAVCSLGSRINTANESPWNSVARGTAASQGLLSKNEADEKRKEPQRIWTGNITNLPQWFTKVLCRASMSTGSTPLSSKKFHEEKRFEYNAVITVKHLTGFFVARSCFNTGALEIWLSAPHFAKLRLYGNRQIQDIHGMKERFYKIFG